MLRRTLLIAAQRAGFHFVQITCTANHMQQHLTTLRKKVSPNTIESLALVIALSSGYSGKAVPNAYGDFVVVIRCQSKC